MSVSGPSHWFNKLTQEAFDAAGMGDKLECKLPYNLDWEWPIATPAGAVPLAQQDYEVDMEWPCNGWVMQMYNADATGKLQVVRYRSKVTSAVHWTVLVGLKDCESKSLPATKEGISTIVKPLAPSVALLDPPYEMCGDGLYYGDGECADPLVTNPILDLSGTVPGVLPPPKGDLPIYKPSVVDGKLVLEEVYTPQAVADRRRSLAGVSPWLFVGLGIAAVGSYMVLSKKPKRKKAKRR